MPPLLKTYPCPHNRVLTDGELDLIAATGWSQWKRVQDAERKRDKKNGDGWKHEN
jgi:hypothetical protein